MRWGRPHLASFAHMENTPPAAPDSEVTASFLGVTSILFDDGVSTLLMDGFFSRPSLPRTALTALRSNPERVSYALNRAGIRSVEAVVCGHSHFDHALDSAYVAQRTGAVLVGGESTMLLGRGADLPDARLVKVVHGDRITAGNFSVHMVLSDHSHPDRFQGPIEHVVSQPAHARDYRCGETWSVLVRHEPTGRTALVHSSANFRPGALAGLRADVAYLAIGQLGNRPREFQERYWRETVTAVGARRVVLTHWDDFFRPLSAPLRALPYAVDDMDASVRALSAMAIADGVRLDLPTAFRRTDPWLP